MSQHCHFDATSFRWKAPHPRGSDAAFWFELSHTFALGSDSDPRQV